MHAAILIKILLEITLFNLMFTTRGLNDCVFLDESEIICSVFQLIFSQHQYLIDHLVKIYRTTFKSCEISKQNMIFNVWTNSTS